MLKIIATNTYKCGAEEIIKQISAADPKNLSVRHVLIVPDRTSFETERRLLAALGGSFSASVLTFRRLASKILPKNTSYLTKKGAIMTLVGIIAAMRPELVCFDKGSESAGFAESIYEVICTLKYNRIPPAAFSTANLHPGLAGKIADISMLYCAYEQFLRDTNSQDSASKLEALIAAIQTDESVKNTYFYICDFENFSTQEQSVIEGLIKHSLGVTVACPYSSAPHQKYLYLNEMYVQMLQVANATNAKYEVVHRAHAGNAMQAQIGKYLFSYETPQKVPLASGTLCLTEAPDAEAELEVLARQICEFVRSGGRYGGVYVVCSDIAPYAATAGRVFADYEIPLFIDERLCLADHAFCRYLLDFLTAARQNRSLESVLPLVKNWFFQADYEAAGNAGKTDVCEFENYCLKYNAAYDFSAFELGKNDPLLENANRVRAKLFEKLEACAFPASASAAEYVRLVREFLRRENAENTLRAFAETQLAAGLTFASAATAQVYEKLTETVDELERVLSAATLPLELFIRVLSQGIAAVSVTVVPQRADTVVLTNMARARKHDIKMLALLGAAQGKMPIVKKDTRLLSDKNITDLSRVGIELAPKMSVENKRERFSLYQLLQEPSERLFVSYCPSGDVDGESVAAPSEFFSALGELFTVCEPEQGENRRGSHCASASAETETFSRPTPPLRFYTRASALKAHVSGCASDVKPNYLTRLKNFLGTAAEAFAGLPRTSAHTRISCGERLFLEQSAASASKIEDFFTCPLRHYYNYGLRLKERKEAKLKPVEFGNVLHDILERFVAATIGCGALEPRRVAALAADCFRSATDNDFWRSILKNVLHAPAVAALKIEAQKMCAEAYTRIQNSNFKPHAVETVFGSAKAASAAADAAVNADAAVAASATPLKSPELKITGKIDRIDVCGDRFIIFDYKTGNVTYAENQLYFGKKIQLPLYASAVAQSLNKTCVGYYYFLLYDTFSDERKARRRNPYVGRTVCEPDIIANLDINFASEGKSTSFGITTTAAGKIRQSAALVTGEQLDAQTKYAKIIARQAAEQMRRGNIDKTPTEDACEFCRAESICDFGELEPQTARCVRPKITAEDILRLTQTAANAENVTILPQADFEPDEAEEPEADEATGSEE